MKNLLKKFSRSSNAQAGIEFAMLLPMMCFLFFGTVEVTQGQLVIKQLAKAVRVATDLPGHSPTLERNNVNGRDELSDILEASAQVIAPFDANLIKMSLAGIEVSADGSNKVVWSGARGDGAQARACGSSITLPPELKPTDGMPKFYIYGEGSYTYTPPTAWFITGSMNFTKELFWPSRSNLDVRSVPPQC